MRTKGRKSQNLKILRTSFMYGPLERNAKGHSGIRALKASPPSSLSPSMRLYNETTRTQLKFPQQKPITIVAAGFTLQAPRLIRPSVNLSCWYCDMSRHSYTDFEEEHSVINFINEYVPGLAPRAVFLLLTLVHATSTSWPDIACTKVQGDHLACAKPPVDIDAKVAF